MRTSTAMSFHGFARFLVVILRNCCPCLPPCQPTTTSAHSSEQREQSERGQSRRGDDANLQRDLHSSDTTMTCPDTRSVFPLYFPSAADVACLDNFVMHANIYFILDRRSVSDVEEKSTIECEIKRTGEKVRRTELDAELKEKSALALAHEEERKTSFQNCRTLAKQIQNMMNTDPHLREYVVKFLNGYFRSSWRVLLPDQRCAY